jgi:hypothetical protein
VILDRVLAKHLGRVAILHAQDYCTKIIEFAQTKNEAAFRIQFRAVASLKIAISSASRAGVE